MISSSTSVVKVGCVSYSAVRDLHQLIKSDSIQKAVKDISTLVSARLKADVSVNLDVNLKGFSGVLDDPFGAISSDKVALYGFGVRDHNYTSPTSNSSRTSMVSSGTEEMSRKSEKTFYADNLMELNLGRTGQLFGSMAESSNGQKSPGSNQTIAHRASKRAEGKENRNVDTSKTESKTVCDHSTILEGISEIIDSYQEPKCSDARDPSQKHDATFNPAKKGARTYVDNAESNRLERVGLSVGYLPASKRSDTRDPSQEPDASLHVSKIDTRTYYVVDDFNRSHGRVGLQVSSIPAPRHFDAKVKSLPSVSKKDRRTLIADEEKRHLERMSLLTGSLSASNYSSVKEPIQVHEGTVYVSKKYTKTYEDNAFNWRVGSSLVSKHTDAKVPSPEPDEISFQSKKGGRRSYADNAYNRRLGRVGLPVGPLTIPKRSDSKDPSP